jgi:hypothetical protein
MSRDPANDARLQRENERRNQQFRENAQRQRDNQRQAQARQERQRTHEKVMADNDSLNRQRGKDMERNWQNAMKNTGPQPVKGLGPTRVSDPIEDFGPSGVWKFCAGVLGFLLGGKTFLMITASHPECPWFMSLLGSLFVGLSSYSTFNMDWFRRVVIGLIWLVIVLAVIVLGYYFISYLINNHHPA